MYKLTNNETILRLADNAIIPNDPANSDYAEYLKWFDAGNTPESADPILEKTYEEKRQAEYPSTADLTNALWKNIVEADPTAMNALQAEREAIEAKYPAD